MERTGEERRLGTSGLVEVLSAVLRTLRVASLKDVKGVVYRIGLLNG